MKKPRRVIITFVSFWVVAIVALYWSSIVRNDQVIFYYGENCPHCKLVEQFMNENQVENRYPMIMKEIMSNDLNKKEFFKKVRVCGLNIQKVGIPLLFDRRNCYVGDKNIINYLHQRINK